MFSKKVSQFVPFFALKYCTIEYKRLKMNVHVWLHSEHSDRVLAVLKQL